MSGSSPRDMSPTSLPPRCGRAATGPPRRGTNTWTTLVVVVVVAGWLAGCSSSISGISQDSGPTGIAGEAQLEFPASQPDVAQSFAETSETLDRVLTALTHLSQRDQEILRLSAFEELTNPEIASVLGIRPSLVRSRLYRARQRLQAVIEGAATAPGSEWEDG